MLRGGDARPQIAVAEGLVADEIDGLYRRLDAFVDLVDEIDTVLRKPDDLGLDARRVITGAAIDREDALDVALDLRTCENRALLKLGFLLEILVLDLAVPLEVHSIDHRVLLDGHHEIVAAPKDAHV